MKLHIDSTHGVTCLLRLRVYFPTSPLHCTGLLIFTLLHRTHDNNPFLRLLGHREENPCRVAVWPCSEVSHSEVSLRHDEVVSPNTTDNSSSLYFLLKCFLVPCPEPLPFPHFPPYRFVNDHYILWTLMFLVQVSFPRPQFVLHSY